MARPNGDEEPRINFSFPLNLGEDLYYDEDTLFKVYHALLRAGLTEGAARYAITDMQNNGILFRERKKTT